MNHEINEWILTALIFLIMGIFTVIVKLTKSKKQINFKRMFALFYINVVAGWGIFSLITAKIEWFGIMPQKVFTIMAVTFVGYDALDRLRKSGWFVRLVEFLIKGKP